MKILVTGANGFIGQSLVAALRFKGLSVRLGVRKSVPALVRDNDDVVEIGHIGAGTDWSRALTNVDTVIHLAGRAHVLNQHRAQSQDAFLDVNYQGTKGLVEASRGRTKRFIFLSTIGVHGQSSGDGVIDASTPICPESAYAESKYKAEECILQADANKDFEAVILRPPLVYGPNAPGNLARLIRIVRRKVPLPLASIRNRRSLIDLEHLVAVIVATARTEIIPNRAYVVANRDVVSTPEIIQAIAKGLGTPARLVPMPISALNVLGSIVGQRRTVEQLTNNLEIDASAFLRDFGDLQPRTTLAGLELAMRTYRQGT